MPDFKSTLTLHAAAVESCLEELLVDSPLPTETARPKQLLAAMRHSSLDGGKRLRPFLLMESASLFGMEPKNSILAASALELIHCYSLVHDDLPAMDDDDMRRGRPTTHKAYDEATAILTGDALLTLAFDVLAREETHSDPQIRIAITGLFARSAGLGGMVGGQMLDLEAEKQAQLAEPEILTLQAMKTGALIRCACEAGATLGGASEAERKQLLEFGTYVGQAFQLADDILDVTSSTEAMGKNTGKDAKRGKGTLVSLLGLEASRERATDLLDEALRALEEFGQSAETLREAARFTIERKS